MTSAAPVRSGTIELCGRAVVYSVRVSPGAKRRRIRVTPSGIEVVIPRGAETEEVSGFLRQNEAWVLQQLEFMERSCGVIRKQTRPNSLWLRGKDRTVHVVEETTTRRYGLVAENGDKLIVRVPTGKAVLANRALELWLRRLARTDLHAALERRAQAMKLKFGRVYIMNQRTRWGGCSARRNLSFNWRLIMTPPEVLDYLAVHELVHLLEPNHSTRFWLTVQSLCPEYARCKKWLRENEWRLRVPVI